MGALIDAILASGTTASDLQQQLAAGASPDERDEDNRAAAVHAITRDRDDLLAVLLDAGVDPAASEYSRKAPHERRLLTTLLHVAAGAGSVAAVRLLIARGTPVDVRDDAGVTPLMDAVAESYHGSFADAGGPTRHPEVVRILLEHGARLDATDAAGRSVLQHASFIVTHVGPAKLQALLDGGLALADPATVDAVIDAIAAFSDRYPYAAVHARACLDVLRAAGFDPARHAGALARLVPRLGSEAVVGAGGATRAAPVDVDAALVRYFETVARPVMKDVRGLLDGKPSQAALDRALVRALSGAGTIHQAIGPSKATAALANIVTTLVNAGARSDVAFADLQGYAALHLAAHLHDPPGLVAAIWATLLAVAATPDVLDAAGRSPLRVALEHDSAQAIEILLVRGADRGVTVFSGDTLWQHARKRAKVAPRVLEVVERVAGPEPAAASRPR